jgi:hypothetical protein
MSLSEDVDIEELVTTKDDLSGADIKAVCSESSRKTSLTCQLKQGYSHSEKGECGLLKL